MKAIPALLLALSLSAPALLAAESAPASLATETSAVPATVDALLERCTKIIRYGRTVSLTEPSRQEAFVTLGLLADPRALPLLEEYLRNDMDPNVRVQIVKALAYYNCREVLPLLEAALKDTSSNVRITASNCLRKLTGKTYTYEASAADEKELTEGTAQMRDVMEEVRRRRQLRDASKPATP